MCCDSSSAKADMQPHPSFAAVLPTRRPVGPSARGGLSSVLRLGATTAPQQAPSLFAQRPSVLGRQRHEPQQLTLFGPPGGHR